VVPVDGRVRILWDQSRGSIKAYYPDNLYTAFVTLMEYQYGTDVTINPLNNTLDTVDFDGYSILWLDAMHWGNDLAYTAAEGTATENFLV